LVLRVEPDSLGIVSNRAGVLLPLLETIASPGQRPFVGGVQLSGHRVIRDCLLPVILAGVSRTAVAIDITIFPAKGEGLVAIDDCFIVFAQPEIHLGAGHVGFRVGRMEVNGFGEVCKGVGPVFLLLICPGPVGINPGLLQADLEGLRAVGDRSVKVPLQAIHAGSLRVTFPVLRIEADRLVQVRQGLVVGLLSGQGQSPGAIGFRVPRIEPNYLAVIGGSTSAIAFPPVGRAPHIIRSEVIAILVQQLRATGDCRIGIRLVLSGHVFPIGHSHPDGERILVPVNLGPELDCRIEQFRPGDIGQGLEDLSVAHVEGTAIQIGARVTRLGPDGLVQVGERPVGLSHGCVGHSPPDQCLGILGIASQPFVEVAEGLLIGILIPANHAPAIIRAAVLGIEANGLREVRGGLAPDVPATIVPAPGAIVVAGFRPHPDGRAAVGDCPLIFVLLGQRAPPGHVESGVLRVQPDGLGQVGNRQVVFVPVFVGHAPEAVEDRTLRLRSNRAGEVGDGEVVLVQDHVKNALPRGRKPPSGARIAAARLRRRRAFPGRGHATAQNPCQERCPNNESLPHGGPPFPVAGGRTVWLRRVPGGAAS
jgi:hypothetical protein